MSSILKISDGIKNVEDFHIAIGAVRTGIKTILNNDQTFEITAGSFEVYNEVSKAYETNDFAGVAPASFSYFTPDGTIIAGTQTNIDPDQYWNGTALTGTPNNDWTQQPILVNTNDDSVLVGYGKEVYVNNGLARDNSRDEDLEVPAALASQGYVLVGAITVQEGQNNLQSANTYLRLADKFGQIKGLTNSASPEAIRKEEVLNIAALPTGTVVGELRYVVAEEANYRWDGAAWEKVSADGVNYVMLPTVDATLELGNNYYGKNTNTYTIPTPSGNDPRWIVIHNTASTTEVEKINFNFNNPVKLPNSGNQVSSLSLQQSNTWFLLYDDVNNIWDLEDIGSPFAYIDVLNNGKELLRGGKHIVYNGGTADLTLKVPSPVGNIIEFYYDSLSTGDIILEQADLAQTPQQLFLNGVNNTQTISLDNKGSWVRLLGNSTNGLWNIQIVRPYDPADNTRILENITFSQVRSAGTNAGSSWSFQIFDEDGNQYPASDWAVTATFTQYAGGTAVLNFDKAITNGTIAIGRNKNAPQVILEYVGQNPNGVSNIVTSGANGTNVLGTTQTLNYEGTNYSDTFSGTPISWTTNNQVEPTDQGAPWLPDTLYPVDAIISHVESDPTDPNFGELFNWKVVTTIADTDHSIWDDTDFAIQTKLERFSIGAVQGEIKQIIVNFKQDDGQALQNSGIGNESFVYIGNTTDQIYKFDASGSNPAENAEEPSTRWADGMLLYVLSTKEEYRYNRGTNKFELVPSSEGLRKSPVADITELTAIAATDAMHQTVLDDGTGTRAEYVFYLGRTPVGTDIADVSGTGAWVKQTLTTADLTTLVGSSNTNTLTLNDGKTWGDLFDVDGYDYIEIYQTATFGGSNVYPAYDKITKEQWVSGDTINWNADAFADGASVFRWVLGQRTSTNATWIGNGGWASPTIRVYGTKIPKEVVDPTLVDTQSTENQLVGVYNMVYNAASDGTYPNNSGVPYPYPTLPFVANADGAYSFDVMPFQTTTSLENGTRTGGTFNLRDSTNAIVGTLTFANTNVDITYEHYPYGGGLSGSQKLTIPNLTAGSYTLEFIGSAGIGAGNRSSSRGYVQITASYDDVKLVIRPEDLVVTQQVIGGVLVEDRGIVREMSGVTPAGSSINTIVFPSGGFNGDPVVTFVPVGTTLREIALNSVSPTQVVIESGGTQAKHWIAKGLKP